MSALPHSDHHVPPRHRHRMRTTLVVLTVMVGLLIVGRILLPGFLKSSINKRLNDIPDYAGEVQDVGISLYRGAYSLHGLEIVKRSGQVREPFFKVESIDFSLSWREMFHGKIVSDIYLQKPELNFVQGASGEASQVETDKRWQEVIEDIFPIDINYLEITDGQIRYVNTATTPKVDIRIAHMHAVATGLRNHATPEAGEFPARIDISGDSIGMGKLRVSTKLEPLAAQPHFLLKLELENVSMPALNEFLRAYANVDVSAGIFKGYLEMTARDGSFQGYFKPFFENVDFHDLPEDADKKNLGQQLWEGVVRFVAFVFKNHEKDQLATRVPFSGEFGNTQVSVWKTIMNTLRHAFVRPWPERLESRTVTPEQRAAEEKKAPAKPPATQAPTPNDSATTPTSDAKKSTPAVTPATAPTPSAKPAGKTGG